MNVKKLIEKIEGLNKLYGEKFYIALDDVLDLVKQLDEPEKVTIPQFVADWLKENDLREETLGEQSIFDAVDNLAHGSKNGYYSDVKRWIDENGDLFARAWLDGYTVEKEKKYKIVMLNIASSGGVLTRIKHDDSWIWIDTLGTIVEGRTHTRKELEDAGFGWVFDCPGIKIEEVTE